MTLYQVLYSNQELSSPFIQKDLFYTSLKAPKIHILIPIYNESNTITKLLTQIEDCFQFYPDYKITVIDDGSTDNSIEKIRLYSEEIHILSNKKNAGKGISLMLGFKHCSNDEIIVTMDGDGEHLPKDIEKIVIPILELTVANGSISQVIRYVSYSVDLRSLQYSSGNDKTA